VGRGGRVVPPPPPRRLIVQSIMSVYVERLARKTYLTRVVRKTVQQLCKFYKLYFFSKSVHLNFYIRQHFMTFFIGIRNATLTLYMQGAKVRFYRGRK
jgi:hypothetical protein